MTRDSVEFYEDGHLGPFLIVDSNFQPNDGDEISIKKETWIVIGRSFSVDYSDDSREKAMRCNIIVERKKP
jgi:hypothetical protein